MISILTAMNPLGWRGSNTHLNSGSYGQARELDDITNFILENKVVEIEPEYSMMIENRDSDWEWQQKLKVYREMEYILKTEGIIECYE